MKYILITIKSYGDYLEREVDSLNSYGKNKVYDSLGDIIIYVDKDNVEFARKKIKKYLEKKYTELINKIP